MKPERNHSRIADHVWLQHNWLEKLAVLGGVILCGLIAMLAGRMFGFPSEPSFNASLIEGGSFITAILVIVVCIFVSTLATVFIAGQVEIDAPVVCAAGGLTWLAGYSGSVGATLRTIGSAEVYQTLLIELILLLAGWIGAAFVLDRLVRQGLLAKEIHAGQYEATSDWGRRFSALGAQALACALILMLVLPAVDSKQHALVAIGAIAYLAAMVAYNLFPVQQSIWMIAGTMLCGIVGYAWAIAEPGLWRIGLPANALAAVSPLDYASLGVCGTTLGYWSARRMRYNAVNEHLQSVESDAQEI